jgi:hypothetical protein
MKCRELPAQWAGRATVEKSDHRHPRVLLRACRLRPYRRAARRDDEISALDLDCHVTLPWEVMPNAVGTLPRFNCEVCGKSAYPPRLSIIADMLAQRPSANTGSEHVQQN